MSAALPPANTPGTLVYTCRLCHVTFNAYPVDDCSGVLSAIVRSYGQLAATPTDPAKLALAQWHACADGRYGVADVAGMQVTQAG